MGVVFSLKRTSILCENLKGALFLLFWKNTSAGSKYYYSKFITFKRAGIGKCIFLVHIFFENYVNRGLDFLLLTRLGKGTYSIETVQDFLIKLGIKLLMHLLEISIFSHFVRLTKIMNYLVKDLKILSFKVIFQCLKLVESFQKNFCV